MRRFLLVSLTSAALLALIAFPVGCSAGPETSNPPAEPAQAKGAPVQTGPPFQPSAQTDPQAETETASQKNSRNTRAPAPSTAIFRDATEEGGLHFIHFNGVTGEYFLPEITGSGGALFDYDNDGDLDLYLVQGAKLLDRPNPPGFGWKGKQPPTDRLYRNDLERPGGLVRFTDITEKAGIQARGYGMGAATGDYNNDGWIDLYVTNLGSNQLLRNNGDGTFTDVTKETGAHDTRWSTSAAFFDYDNDGWLDLFVTNYVNFSAHEKHECFSKTSARDYCGPDAYDPVEDRLFHNKAGRAFEDAGRTMGITAAFGAGLGVITSDLNADGWTDVYVANDGDPNQLWINQQGRAFEDESLLSGVALNHAGQAEASMGVDLADFDGDGDEDLFMTHLDGESNTFYVNLGNGFFEDSTIKVGLHSPSLSMTGFGTRFFDYDNDGRLDLLILNGAVRLQERLARKGEPYPLQQPNQLFRNSGRGQFEDVTGQAGSAFEIEEVSRGVALGDIDNDGDIDVVVFNNNGPARLLLNEVGNRQHWLGLRLLDPKTNRDALQARVEIVMPHGPPLWRRVHTDGSYCSASDPRLLIGLGEDDTPSTVRVHWSPEEIEEWKDLGVDRYWTLQKGRAPATQ